MLRSFGVATLFVAVAGLLACSSSSELAGAPEPAGDGRSAAALGGTTWHLATIEGRPVLEGTTVTAEFSNADSVGGGAGCNTYSGSALAESGHLTVGRLVSTQRACASDAVMQQEQRYLALLQAAKHYALLGTELRLGTSATDVTLVFTSR
jgi:heat shock protein HslJ